MASEKRESAARSSCDSGGSSIESNKVKVTAWVSLVVIIIAHMIGESAHFLITTTSKAIANDVPFGKGVCEAKDFGMDNTTAYACEVLTDRQECLSLAGSNNNDSIQCQWTFLGTGLEYQHLNGLSFNLVYSVSTLIFALMADTVFQRFTRNKMMCGGVFVLSVCCIIFTFAENYYVLVICRMFKATGLAILEPLANCLVGDLFPLSKRGLAEGLLASGDFLGMGMSYILGIELTKLNVFELGWKASYLVTGVCGVLCSVFLYSVVNDPKRERPDTKEAPINGSSDIIYSRGVLNSESSSTSDEPMDFMTALRRWPEGLFTTFLRKPLVIMFLISSSVCLTATSTWSTNAALYFQQYHPEEKFLAIYIGIGAVICGCVGSLVVCYISDRISVSYGLQARFWSVTCALGLSVPSAFLSLYLERPYCFIALFVYNITSECWWSIISASICEICEADNIRTSATAFFFFAVTLVGGNLPTCFELVSDWIGYKFALYAMWPGLLGVTIVLFAVTSVIAMRNEPEKRRGDQEMEEEAGEPMMVEV